MKLSWFTTIFLLSFQLKHHDEYPVNNKNGKTVDNKNLQLLIKPQNYNHLLPLITQNKGLQNRQPEQLPPDSNMHKALQKSHSDHSENVSSTNYNINEKTKPLVNCHYIAYRSTK